MPSVALIDYGASNSLSVSCALERVGLDVQKTSAPAEIASCDGLVIPGVGHFGHASRRLRPLRRVFEQAIDEGKPVLGICLGLQMLFESSEESVEPGLGILRGHCVRVPQTQKAPHIGWNQLSLKRPCRLLDGVPDGSYVYFVHSFHVVPDDVTCITAVTWYGQEIVAAVVSGNVLGTQFHPEKSGRVGQIVLENFSSMVVGDDNESDPCS